MEPSCTDTTRSRLWPGLVVSLLALAFAPAASAATIDFETRAPGETVNAQYASQGVTFNGSKVYDYGANAHSGTRAIENCRGVEFCGSPPIRADFTTGQASVGVWVGYNQGSFGSRAVRLTAFDANGAEVGRADAVLAPNSPANTHLTVTDPGARIRALEVKPSDGSDSYDIFVDDVEFSTAGPPPPCSASSVPTVTLTSPADNTYLQNNTVLLKGRVFTQGAPITAATVVSDGSTTRTAIAFPTPIDANGGDFAINMGGLLQNGNQKIFVTATNCAGTGVSPNPIVTLNPLPATAGFQQLAPVELVQTVQSPYNPVPLIAGGANGTKRTIARVPLAATGVTTPITGVSGRLTATRPDGSRPGGPLTVDSLNTITVGPDQTLEAARASLNSTLNFELPDDWLTEGRLHVQLEQLKIEGAQTALPCKYCDNYGGQEAVKTFHRVPPLRIWLVAVPYTVRIGGVMTTFTPRQKDFDFLSSWLGRAYPTAEVQVTQAALPDQGELPGWDDMDDDGIDENRPGFLCGDINDQLSQFAQGMPAQPAGTRFYGVVADGGAFMRGCSNIGGSFGSGPAGDNRWAWDVDKTYTDWYGGHEIGHLFDRKHPDGGCDDSDDDGSFPFIGGAIGNFVFDNQGVDVGDTSLTPMVNMALLDWRSGATDIMTYCDNEWLSSYTYNGILRNLCNGDPGNCPNRAALTKGAAVKRDGPRLAVSGSLNLASGKVSLGTMSVLKGLTLSPRPRRSKYAIVLRDASGRSLATYPFEPQPVSDQEGQRPATIDAVVPFAPQADRIEIVRGDRVLAKRSVSAHAPVAKLRSPKGKRLNEPVKLRWSARDADGAKLLSTLQYAGDGKHFVTLAAGLKKRKLQVDPATLPGGKRARFRVIVTDGVLAGVDRSKRFTVEAKPPRISIATPVDGAVSAQGQSTQLVASVADDQDARLFDDVVWTSDVQGELGRGGMVTATLAPGTHVLTATVTNSLGKTAAASVTVTVEATPPTVTAQLIP